MKRILLVSSNISREPLQVYPLGLAVVAAGLADAGHQVEQFDFLASGESEALFREKIASFDPDYVCISLRNLDNCDSFSRAGYPEIAKRLVGWVRETAGVPVIIGGPGFSILPEELLAFTGADHGIVGEGERIVGELIRDLSEGRTPPPILRGDRLLDGGEMASPLYNGGMIAYYLEQSGMVNLQTKRGCPHGCIYCVYPSLEGNRFRYRDPKAVVDDIETGGSRARRGQLLLHRLDLQRPAGPLSVDRGGDPPAAAPGPVVLLHAPGADRKEGDRPPQAGGAVRGGTGHRRGVRCDPPFALGKGFSFADALEVNRAFVAERLPCAHFVMFGGPGETADTVTEGLANLERLEHTVVFGYSGIRILPGTALHGRAIAEGVLSPTAPLHRAGILLFAPDRRGRHERDDHRLIPRPAGPDLPSGRRPEAARGHAQLRISRAPLGPPDPVSEGSGMLNPERVLLVHPLGYRADAASADISRIANIMPPLGLASIAACLERRGIRATIVDCYARPGSDRAIRDHLLAERPAFLGLSCTTSSFLDGIRIAEAARATLPGIRTVFGGPHVSALKEALFPRFPAMDFAVVGEGEETLGELIASGGEDPAEHPGDHLPGRRGRDRPVHRLPGPGDRTGHPPLPGVREARRIPGLLQASHLQLPASAEHELHLQPGLSLFLQLLRPLRLPPELPVQLRRISLRAPALPEGAVRHPARQLLRRPVHLPPEAGRSVHRDDDRPSPRDDLQLRRPGRARRPGAAAPHEGGRLLDGEPRDRDGRRAAAGRSTASMRTWTASPGRSG